MSQTEEQRRAQNALRQRRLRDLRDAANRCRTCGAPAAISKRTGRLAKQCDRHLSVDKERKAIVEMPWLADPEVPDPDDDMSGCVRLPWIGKPTPEFVPLPWGEPE